MLQHGDDVEAVSYLNRVQAGIDALYSKAVEGWEAAATMKDEPVSSYTYDQVLAAVTPLVIYEKVLYSDIICVAEVNLRSNRPVSLLSFTQNVYSTELLRFKQYISSHHR